MDPITIGVSIGISVVVALVIRAATRPTSTAGGSGPGMEPPIDSQGYSRRWYPSPNANDGKRGSPPIWIVLHDTESQPGGVDAYHNAEYFFNPAARAAAHLVVDDGGATYRCVDDDKVAWHAGVVNPRSLGIEMAAPAGAAMSWSAEEWMTHDRLLETAAARVASWCKQWKIPARFVTGDQLAAGVSGITTHAEVTKGFSVPKGHMDPGPGFPIEDFIERVRRRVAIA